MLKCLELREQFSCLNKARSDEPIFVLRANDPLFGATIRHWAAMAHEIHEGEKIADANLIADQGEQWREARRGPAAVEVPKLGGAALGSQAEQRRR